MAVTKHFVKLVINPIKKHQIIDLAALDILLLNLSKFCYISKIDIVGNELNYLSNLYFDLLFNVLKLHCQNLNVYTEFENLNESLINNFDIINVFYNFNNTYDNGKVVFNNIKAGNESGKIINVKTFDTGCISDSDKVIMTLNKMQIKSWELIPDHSNLKALDYTKFEKLVSIYYKLANKMNFAFQNKLQLDGILNLNNYNQSIVYVTSDTKIAIQNFNKNKFSLQAIENVEQINSILSELENIQDNFCKKCTSKIKCMANYYNNYSYKGKSCCGLKNLLKEV